jgi:hypothetical protein
LPLLIILPAGVRPLLPHPDGAWREGLERVSERSVALSMRRIAKKNRRG